MLFDSEWLLTGCQRPRPCTRVQVVERLSRSSERIRSNFEDLHRNRMSSIDGSESTARAAGSSDSNKFPYRRIKIKSGSSHGFDRYTNLLVEHHHGGRDKLFQRRMSNAARFHRHVGLVLGASFVNHVARQGEVQRIESDAYGSDGSV